jgi:hypothetical protein
MIADVNVLGGVELIEEVGEELEAVEDIVEEVTHLKDDNPVEESEIALGMMIQQSFNDLENQVDEAENVAIIGGGTEHKGGVSLRRDSDSPKYGGAHKRHHHVKAVVDELHDKAERAADKLQSSLKLHSVRLRIDDVPGRHYIDALW